MTFARLAGTVTGDALVSYWTIFFVVPSNSPRSLCESKLGPVSFWFLKWRIVKYPFFSGIITGEESVSYWSIFSLSLVTAPEVFAKVNLAQSPCFQIGESLIIVRQRYFNVVLFLLQKKDWFGLLAQSYQLSGRSYSDLCEYNCHVRDSFFSLCFLPKTSPALQVLKLFY